MARPEPMNATLTHSKVKLSLFFPDPLFVAGDHVSGKMELECKAERGLGISDIKVELFAIQELTSRDHSATNTFLHLTRYFQGPGLPPSNAVHPHPLPGNENTLPVDYYLARKGMTTFFFRFPLPLTSPSSIDFGKGLAKLKYEVRASAGVSWRSERLRVMERREIVVVEAPGSSSEVERIVVGENGKIWVQGRILNPYVVAGRDACVELLVKNHSTKRTGNLSLSLARRLHLPASSQHSQKGLQISDVLATVPFRGPDYIVQPGTEGVANLVFTVSKDAQGVRSGPFESGDEDEGHGLVESIFDVRCLIEIKMGMGFGSKDIVLELPVVIVHPAAMGILPPLPDRYPVSPEPPHRIYSPPALAIPGYQSPPPGPSYDAFSVPYMSPPISPPHLAPNIPVWSPPPPQAIQPQLVHDQYDQYYYYPPPPMEYAYPARSSSADPFVAGQLPILPIQYNNVAPRPPPQDVPLADPVSDEARPEQGEPGKGERASRISAHLRMSSRHRSVSPPSHRFPQTSLPPIVDGLPVQPQTTQLSPLDVEFPRMSPTEEKQEVLSPRPVLTPRQSFSLDRGTVKSEHVLDLERMAAAEVAGQSNKDDRNKTLPPRPSASETPDTPRLPPEPTLLPIPTHPRPEIWSRDSGLAALERKLLEQVGTRKPDAERRVDVRSILPDPIMIPSPNDPRCDPPNDSAISSLALGADMSFDENRHSSAFATDGKALPVSPTKPESTIQKDRSPDRRVVNGREKGKRNHSNQLRKAATGRVAAWLGGLGAASPPPDNEAPGVQSVPETPVEETPAPADLNPHPLLRSPALPIPEASDEPKNEPIPTRSSGFVLHVAKDTSSSFIEPDPEDSDETPRQSQYQVEPVSSSKTPTISTPSPLKPVLRRFAEGPGKNQLLDNKYDIRSARGGRGGKVTSVAALWASLAAQQESASSANPPVKQAGTFSPAFKGAQPLDKHKVATKTPPHVKKDRNDASPKVNAVDLSARRARMVKSTSVPAVLSSSLATPVLSSTASLARPIQAPYPKRAYPPKATTLQIIPTTISEQQRTSEASTPRALPHPTTKSPVSNDLAFGQARLKDLIKKYQQGF